MTGDSGLAVVLRSQSEHLQAIHAQAEADLAAAQDTSDRIGDLERELLGGSSCIDTGAERRPRVSRRSTGAAPSFGSLRDQAASHLTSLGFDPRSASLDDLLDDDEITRIERRFDPDFSLHARLDPIDVLAISAAGLTASLLDVLVVGIPRATNWWGGGGRINPSPLTERLRRLSISSDNQLAKWAKTSYDRVSDLPEHIDGFGGLTHRVQTFGHDPLLGLVFGVADIMRGTMTAIPRGGGIRVMKISEGESNPFLAMALQLGHLLSDVGTRSGLPLPGWTALVSLGGPTFGPRTKGGPILQPVEPETIGGIARRMYLNGYDSWHFASMATSAVAVEVILRSYWGLRSNFDPDWKDQISAEADRNGSTGVCDHPRFASMSLGAHGIAATGNVVKVAIAGGNPLALNYPQWLMFLKAFYRWADDRQGSINDRVDRTIRANARAAEAGWARLDFTDRKFTTLTERFLSPT